MTRSKTTQTIVARGINPVYSPCIGFVSSFKVISPPEFGTAVVKENTGGDPSMLFVEPDHFIEATRDVMEFEMCIDSGTEMVCRDFVQIVNYK